MNANKFARFPFNPTKWPFFYGWMIIAFGTMGILVSIPGQTIGVSTFTDSLIDVLKISRDQVSLAYMIGTIASSLLLTKAGALYDKVGVRPVAGVGAIGLGLALLLLSQIDVIVSWLGIFQDTVATIALMTLAFSFIRFFGQGVLTLASRTMMMKWFDARRGFATSFSSVFTALGFSSAPYFFEILIQQYDWDGAWFILGLVACLAFPIVILIFYRNSPEESGLLPDGGEVVVPKGKNHFPVIQDFDLPEARSTLIFWVIGLFLAMQALYTTGFTFHVVSIFEQVGLTRTDAVSIFLPMSIFSVVTSLSVGWVSDYVKLNKLLYLNGSAAIVSLIGFLFLGQADWAYWMLVAGFGVMGGMFGVLSIVCWPRLFGKSHLGKISGFSMTIMVFASALGPILYSLSLSQFGNYYFSALLTLLLYIGLTILSFWVKNPQAELAQKS